MRLVRSRAWRRKSRESDLNRELAAHLELEAAERVEAGMSAGEARMAARRALGNATYIKEATREMWGWRWLGRWVQDFRYAARVLVWNPGFSVVAVAALALGIGANTAIYSILNAVWLRMLPVDKPQELVVVTRPAMVANEIRYTQSYPYPLYRDLRDRAQTLQSVIAYRSLTVAATLQGAPERITGALVSGNYFGTLGVPAAVGSLISPEDDQTPGSGGRRGPVAVLSNSYWRRRFGGDQSVLGKTIDINSTPFTVVGVAGAGFSGTEVGESPEVFAPMMMQSALMPENANALEGRGNQWLRIMGRMRAGHTPRQAEAELTLLLRQYNEDLLTRLSDVTPARRQRYMEQTIALLPGGAGSSELRRRFSQPGAVLMSLAGFVLLIACANVANMLLTRATGRQREIAIRAALGATRSRLVSQLLAESLLLAFAGSIGGLLVARWVRDLLIRFLPAAQKLDVSIDWQVLGFCLLLGLATGLLFGVTPALRATRAVKSETPARVSLRKSLVVAQVALSMLLLTGAGLFIRSLRNLQAVDPGFSRDGVLLFSVDPALEGYKNTRLAQFYQRLLDRVKTLPGVISASIADFAPLENHSGTDMYVEGYQARPDEPRQSPSYGLIGPGYFATMNIPILLGRDIDERDNAGAPKVVVVNETFAKFYFPGENPVGKRLGHARGEYDTQIVGVVKDSKYTGLREGATRMVYFSAPQSHAYSHMVFHVRAAGDPMALSAAVRERVRELDANLPVFGVKTVREEIDQTLTQDKLIATLPAMFGSLALLLSAVGLYGVMSYAVSRRVREIGIRMALGAERGSVIRTVLGEAAMLTGLGILLGLPGAYAAGRLTSSMLYGIDPGSPLAMLLPAAVLSAASLAAAWIPARHAARIEPMAALRYE